MSHSTEDGDFRRSEGDLAGSHDGTVAAPIQRDQSAAPVEAGTADVDFGIGLYAH